MNINETYGKELPLGQLLSCREERVAKQQALFDEYSLPIICLTLNIAGPVKRYALADEAFGIAFDFVKNALGDGGFVVRHFEKAERDSSFEGYFVIDGDALEIKRLTAEIEESKAYFRLLDVDVIKPDGNKVSRSEIGKGERKCLVCDNSAAACGRSRAHGLDVIIDKTHQLLREMVYDFRADKIAGKAVQALLDEVYTTPKPGLVDLANCGAHSDMDVALFEKSARVLYSYFHKMCVTGQMSEDCFDALSSLRDTGKDAEKAMFEATNGVNTHKGAIFSAGIMAYCAGFILGQSEEISAEKLHEVCRKVCINVLDDFADISSKSQLTAGEQYYSEHKIAGIRGEAHAGFPAVFYMALPFYRDLLSCGKSRNDAGCMVLLQLMAQIEDTNVLKRGGMNGLMQCMNRSKHLLSVNLPLGELIEEISRFDEDMIKLNLSPGGCADLLALTYFVHSIT